MKSGLVGPGGYDGFRIGRESTIRIAVIGARRQRQGIGAHLARFLVEAGADVVRLVGTTEATAKAAVLALAEATGHRALPSTDFVALAERESLDAVVIASPHSSHAPYLDLALAHGLHVFCEKPVVWGGRDPAGRALRLGEGFRDAGLHLVANTQWPLTLGTYDALCPGARDAPQRFQMRLSPSSSGLGMLLDALPHPLSLLYATAGAGGLADIHFSAPSGSPDEHLEVGFRYDGTRAGLDVRIELIRTAEQPRPAAYGFDGHIARREIEMSDYALFFRSGDRRIPLPDPTPLLVRSFLERLAAGPPEAIDPAIVPGMDHLVAICDTYARAGVTTGRTQP